MRAVVRQHRTFECWDTARGPVYKEGDQYYLDEFYVTESGEQINQIPLTEAEARCLCTEENRQV